MFDGQLCRKTEQLEIAAANIVQFHKSKETKNITTDLITGKMSEWI